MKNILMTTTIFLLIFTSCTTGNDVDDPLTLEGMTFKELKLEMGKGIEFDYSNKSNKQIKSKAIDLIKTFDRILETDKNIENISYQMK